MKVGPCCRACCGAGGAGGSWETGYSGTNGNCPRYVCALAKQLYAGEHVCQSIGGVRLENRVLDELFAVLAPAALTATAQALAEADANYRRELAVFELGVERARSRPTGRYASSTTSSRRIVW